MKPFCQTSIIFGVLISAIAVVRGLKKETLSRSGAAAAFCVGFLSVGSGLRGFVLLMFYQVRFTYAFVNVMLGSRKRFFLTGFSFRLHHWRPSIRNI